MGSWKVTVLVIFLWPLGEGGSATWLTWIVAAKFGTLNCMKLNLSDIVEQNVRGSGIFKHVETCRI